MKPQKIRKTYLLAPGPTPVPPSVCAVASQPIGHHRTPQFEAIYKECTAGMQYVFCTKHDLLILNSTGTGAMEAAVANTVNRGDKVICATGGKFGERWVKLCKVFGAEVVTISVPYGAAIDPAQIRDALKENPDAKAVFTQLSETSTGCVFDIKAIGEIVAETSALFIVDGISGVGAERCPTDAWQIDILVTGSQKGLMLPPGLAFASVSPKAWAVIDACKSPRFYFNLRSYQEGLDSGQAPYTPNVSLFMQLHEALNLIKAETMEGMWARHKWLADATRAGMKALGLELFAQRPGNVLTAVKVPAGVDGGGVVKTLRDQFGISITGGQGDMKGKIFRVAHLGYVDRFDTIMGLAAVEMALRNQEVPVKLGAGVAAAQEILRHDPQL